MDTREQSFRSCLRFTSQTQRIEKGALTSSPQLLWLEISPLHSASSVLAATLTSVWPEVLGFFPCASFQELHGLTFVRITSI